MGLLESEILAHLLIGIAIAVGLVVSLIHHVDTPAVTEFVEVFTVGIVRGTQEVNVRLFHQPDIFLVGGVVDVAACLGMMVVTVHALQLHVLTIDLKDFANDFHLLHTQMIVEMLNRLISLIAQLHAERIEVRLLGRPELGFLQRVVNGNGGSIASRELINTACYLLAIDLKHSLQMTCCLLTCVT